MSEQDLSPSQAAAVAPGSTSMTTYRAYKIGWEGRIIAVAQLDECIDDAGAVEAAKRLGWGYVVEIWDRDRFVAMLPCEDRR